MKGRLKMGACCCSLAGTDACKHCLNGSTDTNYYHSDYVYYPLLTKDQLDSVTRKEDEWEIPSFMLKEEHDS